MSAPFSKSSSTASPRVTRSSCSAATMRSSAIEMLTGAGLSGFAGRSRDGRRQRSSSRSRRWRPTVTFAVNERDLRLYIDGRSTAARRHRAGPAAGRPGWVGAPQCAVGFPELCADGEQRAATTTSSPSRRSAPRAGSLQHDVRDAARRRPRVDQLDVRRSLAAAPLGRRRQLRRRHARSAATHSSAGISVGQRVLAGAVLRALPDAVDDDADLDAVGRRGARERPARAAGAGAARPPRPAQSSPDHRPATTRAWSCAIRLAATREMSTSYLPHDVGARARHPRLPVHVRLAPSGVRHDELGLHDTGAVRAPPRRGDRLAQRGRARWKRSAAS